MKHLILAIIMATACVSGLHAGASYEATSAKAYRFFEGREWASAQALYGLMLAERPDIDSTYEHAIIASAMLGDTDRASLLLADAMKAGISFENMMEGIRDIAFNIGEPDKYEEFLLRSQRDCPWLSRAIDAELLRYYLFRDNGNMIIAYAGKMLNGLPDSIDYRSALAKGYMLTGDFHAAVNQWQQILQENPNEYNTLLSLGNYLAIAGNNESAIIYLERAMSIHPTPFVASRLQELGYYTKKR